MNLDSQSQFARFLASLPWTERMIEVLEMRYERECALDDDYTRADRTWAAVLYLRSRMRRNER